jgi:hypothetical protein
MILRILELAFQHQTSSSIIEKVIVQLKGQEESHNQTIIKDIYYDMNNFYNDSSDSFISKDVQSLLKIVEDCKDQEAIVNRAMNLLLSCSDEYIQSIDPLQAISLLLSLVCEQYPSMWKVHAVLLRFGQRCLLIAPFPGTKHNCQSILTIIDGRIRSKALLQVWFWTLSCLCRDDEFRQGKTCSRHIKHRKISPLHGAVKSLICVHIVLSSKLNKQMISNWFQIVESPDRDRDMVIPLNLEFLLTTGLRDDAMEITDYRNDRGA